ncbi:MAG: DEAD/DEAH box helicase family protein [Planctomycetota bacterium]
MTRFTVTGLLVLGNLIAVTSGCALPAGQKTKLSIAELGDLPSLKQKEALRNEIKNAIEFVENEISSASDEIERNTDDLQEREAAIRWKIHVFEYANDISLEMPFAVLLDLWAFTLRQEEYLIRGEGRQLFGDLQPVAIESAGRMKRRVETAAREEIPEDRIAGTIRAVENFARDNPIRGVFAIQLEEPLTDEQRVNIVTKIIGIPGQLAAGGRQALDPTSSLAQSVDRFTTLMEDYPALVRWQTQLLMLEVKQSSQTQQVTNGIEGISQSAARLASVSETLPQDVRKQVQLAMDDAMAHQPEIRETLDQARQTVDTTNEALQRVERISETFERTIDSVTRTGEVWQGTAGAVTETIKEIQKLRPQRAAGETTGDTGGVMGVDGDVETDAENGGGNDVQAEAETTGQPGGGDGVEAGVETSERRRFDIYDYKRTAEALTGTTQELRELLSEARAFLDGDTVERNVSQVDALTASALEQTVAQTRVLINLAAWRAVQLCGLIFVLAIVYRLTMRRFAVA